MTTYTDNITTNKTFTGNYIIRFNGLDFGAHQPDSGLTIDADKVGTVIQLRVNEQRVDLRRVNTNISSITFGILDIDQVITKLFKDNETIFLNDEVEIFLGRIGVGMDFADYFALPKLRITDVQYEPDKNTYTFQGREITDKMVRAFYTIQTTLDVDILPATTIITASTTGFPTSGFIKINEEFMSYTGTTGTTFTGVTRAELGTTAVEHKAGSIIDHVVEISGNPLDLFKQLLISNGGGGPYDILFDGLGFDPTLIDITAIDAVRNEFFTGETFRFQMFNIPNALKFLEEEILLACNCRLVISNDQKISIAVLDQATFADEEVGALDNDHIININRYKVSKSNIINRILIFYDYNEATDKFLSFKEFTDSDSQVNFDDSRTLTLNLKGVKTADGGLSIVNDRGGRLLLRFTKPTPEIILSTHISKSLLNIGDSVSVSTDRLPHPNGTLVFSDTLEVIRRSIDHLTGIVRFTLAYTSYTGIRVAYVAPCPAVAAVTSQSIVILQAGGGAQFEVGYKLKLWNDSTDAFESDPVNTILSISGDTVTFENAWVTTLNPAVHRFRFADYDEVIERQKRFGFVGKPGGGDFDSDSTGPYKVIL